MSRFADDFDEGIIVRPEHQIDPPKLVEDPEKAADDDKQEQS